MTKIVNTIGDWKAKQSQETNKSIGFVPTMGNLHQGHQSLLNRSVLENNITVLSIFVNPAQFNDKNDLTHYPRTLEKDIELARQCKVDYIFLPDEKGLYPDGFYYQVHEVKNSRELEGEFRPGHFTGVLTVVLKLLMLIKPTRTYFGEKDYQQLQLVRGMCNAFFIDTKIIGCETIRDGKGLALSSRNSRLTSKQYQLAQQFAKLFHSGLTCDQIKEELKKLNIKTDYLIEKEGRRFGAVYIDDIRLIDNRSIV